MQSQISDCAVADQHLRLSRAPHAHNSDAEELPLVISNRFPPLVSTSQATLMAAFRDQIERGTGSSSFTTPPGLSIIQTMISTIFSC